MASFPVQQWNLGVGPVVCHTWNKDRTLLAISPSTNLIYIFQWEKGNWKLLHTLTEHDLPVTGLDWGQNSDRIVSCSQDKNAFVWSLDGGKWKPELVLVRINRAATAVKWSPAENKFAVASGAKLVSVCYYEKENDWWVSKQIKKPIRSTVTCVAWHPNNVVLAVGACDFKARVFSAYVKDVDEKPSPNPWGTKLPFGHLLAEVSCCGWVHDVTFSPSGCRLAFVSHDSSVYLIDTNKSLNESIQLKTQFLPFTCVQWVTENTLVAAGHDCSPMLFTFQDNKLQFVTKLDISPEQKSNNQKSAMQKFKNIDRTAVQESINVTLPSLHQNTITEILPHTGKPENIQKFTTCGIDGLIALWDLKDAPVGAK